MAPHATLVNTFVFGGVLVLAFIASTISGVTGFGGAVLMLPALVAAYGARPAVVILTIAQAVGNGSRAFFGRHAIDWKVAGLFVLGAVPSAIAGSVIFADLSVVWLERLLGIFLLATVVYRHTAFHRRAMALWGFVPVGVAFGFLSAILGSVGPFVAPWFLSYGLLKTAYVATEAVGALCMHATKALAYRNLGLISAQSALIGLALSPAMIAGSYVGRNIVERLPERIFALLIELVLIFAGLQLLIFAKGR